MVVFGSDGGIAASIVLAGLVVVDVDNEILVDICVHVVEVLCVLFVKV
jgi:hypothetical protein